jgi:hypothetical protein
MGWEGRALTITAALSNHNSEQDVIDEQLWEDLKRRIEALLSEEKYKPISPMS